MSTRRTVGPHPSAGARILTAAFMIAATAIVSPTALAGPDVPLRLPVDRVYDEQASPDAVVFSHLSHTVFTDNDCLACHPQPFSILGRHQPVRHESLNAGASCGICHNGQDATSVTDLDSCGTCHTGIRPAGEAPAAGPPALRLARGADSPGRVIFRHETHDQGCNSCHPRPFAMQTGATTLDKNTMLEGATCGTCHDGNAAFGVEDDERCETCHMPGEGGL